MAGLPYVSMRSSALPCKQYQAIPSDTWLFVSVITEHTERSELTEHTEHTEHTERSELTEQTESSKTKELDQCPRARA